MHILYTDGGARGNPGPAAAGIVLLGPNGETIKEFGVFLGKCTNNEAEYRALITGLKSAQEAFVSEISCVLDSELLVKQLNGEYKVKSSTLRVLYDQVKSLQMGFKKIEYMHVRRHKNKRADEIVNEVLDSL